MSKETKLGLLISLGVILGFAMIISIHLSRTDEHAAQDPSKSETQPGDQVADAGDAIDEEAANGDGQADSDPVTVTTVAEAGEIGSGDDVNRAVIRFTGDGSSEDETTVALNDETNTTVDPPPVHNGESTEPAGTVTHTVAKGDSLGKISQQYYGTSRKVNLILAANPGVKPTTLKIGAALKIPSAPASVTPEPTPVPTPVPANNTTGAVTHTVAKGDNLGTISQKYYGTSRKVDKIVAANPGVNPNALRIGASLKIPVDPASATPPTIIRTPARPTSPTPPTNVTTDTRIALDEVRRRVDALPVRGTHTVVDGDTLSSISNKYYGTPSKVRAIQAVNPGVNPNTLKVGQVIKLPSLGTEVASVDGPVLQ